MAGLVKPTPNTPRPAVGVRGDREVIIGPFALKQSPAHYSNVVIRQKNVTSPLLTEITPHPHGPLVEQATRGKCRPGAVEVDVHLNCFKRYTSFHSKVISSYQPERDSTQPLCLALLSLG